MSTPIPIVTTERASTLLASAYATAYRASADKPVESPTLLLVFPPTWNNRYQSLLYSEAGPRGYMTLGLLETKLLSHISWLGPIVLHAHWFAGIFKNCVNEIQAAERFTEMRHDIEQFRRRTGAKLLWTAHNVFPHGNAFPKTFLALRQWLFETFDCIHVMQSSHVSILEEAFERSAPQNFVVPHMTYNNSHADFVSPAAAKAHYGISENTFVFAYFGAINPYKNLENFLDAFDRVRKTCARPINVIIGGVPSHPGTVQNLQQKWGADPDVRLFMKVIPDYEIQHIHRAADVMVLPYSETLNSGAAFMAASFNMSFIMPEGHASRALEGLGVMRFNPENQGELEETMLATINGSRGSLQPEAQAQVASNHVSKSFFDQLDQLLASTRNEISVQ